MNKATLTETVEQLKRSYRENTQTGARDIVQALQPGEAFYVGAKFMSGFDDNSQRVRQSAMTFILGCVEKE
jgi:hypothetical protein